jgi:hypothetical protein
MHSTPLGLDSLTKWRMIDALLIGTWIWQMDRLEVSFSSCFFGLGQESCLDKNSCGR